MGKTIVAEDKIQSQIESFLTLDEWNVGVIVGQVCIITRNKIGNS